MKKRIAIILKAALIACCAVSLAGCGQERNKDRLCGKLEERYGEEFRIVDYYDYDLGFSSGDGPSVSAMLSPKENPEVMFEAKLRLGNESLYDEYVAACVFRKMENRIEENLSMLPVRHFVRVRTGNKYVEPADPDMSIEEYCSLLENEVTGRFAVYLYVDREAAAEEVLPELEKTFNGLEMMEGNLLLQMLDNETYKEVEAYWAVNCNSYYGVDDILLGHEPTVIPFGNGKLEEFENINGV